MVLIGINGICAMRIVWPTSTWAFAPAPRKLFEYVDDGLPETSARRAMVKLVLDGADRNGKKLKPRVLGFRIQIGALVAEVVVLMYALVGSQ